MGAQGVATLNFGAFPGTVEATVDVTGQAGYTASNLVEAWIIPVATADHGVEEHVFTPIVVKAYFKANGEFTIIGFLEESYGDRAMPTFRPIHDRPGGGSVVSRRLLYGQWSVAWVWN